MDIEGKIPNLKGREGKIDGPRVPLNGARVKVIRQSQRTAGITVEFLEDRRPYKKGDHVQINRYEFKVDPVATETGRWSGTEIHRSALPKSNIVDENDRAGYWCHCPVCDARTLCEIAATPLRDVEWSKYTCGA